MLFFLLFLSFLFFWLVWIWCRYRRYRRFVLVLPQYNNGLVFFTKPSPKQPFAMMDMGFVEISRATYVQLLHLLSPIKAYHFKSHQQMPCYRDILREFTLFFNTLRTYRNIIKALKSVATKPYVCVCMYTNVDTYGIMVMVYTQLNNNNNNNNNM